MVNVQAYVFFSSVYVPNLTRLAQVVYLLSTSHGRPKNVYAWRRVVILVVLVR